MVFSSLTFLHLFLPAVLLAYFGVLAVQKGLGVRSTLPLNAVLLVASLLFYAWGEGGRVSLLVASAGISFLAGLLLSRLSHRSRTARATVLMLAVASELAILACYKYAGFIAGNLPAGEVTSRLQDWTAEIALPLGISFFTFQTLSYVIDVWRGDVEPARNPLDYLLFVTFFPQLVAGPIVRYPYVSTALRQRKETLAQFASGARRFILGLGKKVLIANVLSVPADRAFGSVDQLSLDLAWLGIAAYTLQLYFDFSGYSDMAIGLGRMFGFEFPENFRSPYAARSITDFWRRWHITLSTWFRDYLYIPLGGNRHGPLRTFANLLVVFAACGFWHGANWTFLAWGLYHGVFLVLERLVPEARVSRLSILGPLWTLPIVMGGWLIFRSRTLEDAWTYALALAGSTSAVSIPSSVSLVDVPVLLALCGGTLLCIPRLEDALRQGEWNLPETVPLGRYAGVAATLAYAAVFAVSVNCLLASLNNPFIYFRF